MEEIYKNLLDTDFYLEKFDMSPLIKKFWGNFGNLKRYFIKNDIQKYNKRRVEKSSKELARAKKCVYILYTYTHTHI